MIQFYFDNQELILLFMSYWMIFVGFISFCCLMKSEAPYERYSNYEFGKPYSS